MYLRNNEDNGDRRYVMDIISIYENEREKLQKKYKNKKNKK